MEEEAHLVINSPRRVLRKNQEAEVYGFVGSISIVVTTVIFLIWAYIPDEFLKFIEIHYYFPSKYWAIAMPTYLMVTVLLALVFYIGLNFMATSTPISLHTLFDEYSREAESFVLLMKKEEDMPIDPISDIDSTRINDLMFGSSHSK